MYDSVDCISLLFEQAVQIVDVGLVVFVIVQVHDFRTDHRFQVAKVVG